MAKTIIQTIGPLYGEVVNGTVFGRPNGSIYVPASNKITVKLPSEYIKVSGQFIAPCNSAGVQISGETMVYADSQDTANRMTAEVATDVDFTDVVGSGSWAVGIFNVTQSAITRITGTLVDGTKYYIRAQLVTSSNVPVATSEVIEVTGVVPA